MVMLQLPYKKSARRLNRFPGWLQMVLPLPSIPLLLRITVPEKKTESMPDIGPLWKSYFHGVFSAPYFWYAFRLRFLRFSSQNLMLSRWESATWWSLVFLNYLAAWRLQPPVHFVVMAGQCRLPLPELLWICFESRWHLHWLQRHWHLAESGGAFPSLLF